MIRLPKERQRQRIRQSISSQMRAGSFLLRTVYHMPGGFGMHMFRYAHLERLRGSGSLKLDVCSALGTIPGVLAVALLDPGMVHHVCSITQLEKMGTFANLRGNSKPSKKKHFWLGSAEFA
jgi:hypothetical protein